MLAWPIEERSRWWCKSENDVDRLRRQSRNKGLGLTTFAAKDRWLIRYNSRFVQRERQCQERAAWSYEQRVTRLQGSKLVPQKQGWPGGWEW